MRVSSLLDVFCSHPATQTRSTACQRAVCRYQHLLQWNVFKVFLSSCKNTLKHVFPDFDRSLPHFVKVEASRFTLSSLWDWSSSRTCGRISISITLRQGREAKKFMQRNLLKSFAVWGILLNRSMEAWPVVLSPGALISKHIQNYTIKMPSHQRLSGVLSTDQIGQISNSSDEGISVIQPVSA